MYFDDEARGAQAYSADSKNGIQVESVHVYPHERKVLTKVDYE